MINKVGSILDTTTRSGRISRRNSTGASIFASEPIDLSTRTRSEPRATLEVIPESPDFNIDQNTDNNIMAPIPAMECTSDGCPFRTSIQTEDVGQLLSQMQIHVLLHHPNGARQVQWEEMQRQGTNQRKVKAGEVAIWNPTNTYEEWLVDLNQWKIMATDEGMNANAMRFKLKESLKISPNKEVKDYFIENMMKDGQSTEPWDLILEKLKSKFGMEEDEEWTNVWKKIRDFRWKDKKAVEVCDEMERLRLDLG